MLVICIALEIIIIVSDGPFVTAQSPITCLNAHSWEYGKSYIYILGDEQMQGNLKWRRGERAGERLGCSSYKNH